MMKARSLPYKKRIATAVVAASAAYAMVHSGVAHAQGNAREGVEEILVTGQEVGSLRLNTLNGAGSRLGLTAFETPAAVDLISAEEIAVKGDYDPLAAVT